MCERNNDEASVLVNNKDIMKNLYFYHKNNILLRIVQTLLSIYIGEGLFLFTKYNEAGYKIDEQLGYKIVFVPLCFCLIGGIIFTTFTFISIMKKVKNGLKENRGIDLRCFNVRILHLVILTHTSMGLILAFLFLGMVDEKNNYAFILNVLVYSFVAGLIWGLMDYFSDMQISCEKFSNQMEVNSSYKKRRRYFYLYLIAFLSSVIAIVGIFMLTMISFDSDILKQILYGNDQGGETGVYVFIATQLSLVVIYLKLAISRIHCDNNVFFDFCEL